MPLLREPYPGLRPYLDFEAPLLHGRDRQVREVVERLAASQFVAIVGGSGSGKSSLVTAGVMPELRSFGIPGAGDLWLAMRTTPGASADAAPADARAAANAATPITRLATRFAPLLARAGDAPALEQDAADIAAVVREEAGFARLLDAFAHRFDLPGGLSPDEARLLIVIDQFEEVFHPALRGHADAQALVERVLDHFYAPHPRCYVVLTMRSEYLADCAEFLELPDAINKASYLVRRMSEEELRAAIVGPAQQFLRLLQRTLGDDAARLPQAVDFEPEVIERLLRDTQAIAGDPDHLPLLQHLLARMWQTALEREDPTTLLPATITDRDLARAAQPGSDADPDPQANLLRLALAAWPERVFQWLAPDDQQDLRRVMESLAWRDPVSGRYSAQRMEVAALLPLLGHGTDAAGLRRLLGEGFIGGVDYLTWDDSDPARPTLQVSHESLIRGWPRLRNWIDARAERTEVWLATARSAAQWKAGLMQTDLLLSGRELAALTEADRSPGDAGLLMSLRSPDGQPLPPPDEVLAYVAASQRARAQQEQRRRRVRQSLMFSLIAPVFFILIPLALYAMLVQRPAEARTRTLLAAAEAAQQEGEQQQRDLAAWNAAWARRARLTANAERATQVLQARAEPTGLARSIGGVLRRLQGSMDSESTVQRVAAVSVPLVQSRLREALAYAPWPVAAPTTAPIAREPVALALSDRPDAPSVDLHVGTVVDGGWNAAIAAGDGTDRSAGAWLYRYDTLRQRAQVVRKLDELDAAPLKRMVFDADVQVALLAAALGDEVGLVPLDANPLARPASARRFQDAALASALQRATGLDPRRAVPAPTWRVAGARVLLIGERHWLVVDDAAELDLCALLALAHAALAGTTPDPAPAARPGCGP